MGEHSYLKAQKGPTRSSKLTQIPGTGGTYAPAQLQGILLCQDDKTLTTIPRHVGTKTERSVNSSCVAQYWAVKNPVLRELWHNAMQMRLSYTTTMHLVQHQELVRQSGAQIRKKAVLIQVCQRGRVQAGATWDRSSITWEGSSRMTFGIQTWGSYVTEIPPMCSN